jgi:hypothetical protein
MTGAPLVSKALAVMTQHRNGRRAGNRPAPAWGTKQPKSVLSARDAQRGIAPTLLLEQVRNTAPWMVTPPHVIPAACILARAVAVEASWASNREPIGYLEFLIAAHFATVATFVPTDVDQRIRELAWKSLSREQLPAAVDAVLALTEWPVEPVTERYVVVGKQVVAGHHGEWLSILAGALGRALSLEDEASAARCKAWIDAELDRELKMLRAAVKSNDIALQLRFCTTLAHNLGDLSRVVDSWPESLRASPIATAYSRLGHEPSPEFGDWFVRAGELNKAKMAQENHRFLALRTPRALRKSRELLLPIGPYFYDWGKLVGSSPELSEADRLEIVSALLTTHMRRDTELGCLRALAGINAALAGDLQGLVKQLPQSERQLALRGPVREALRTPEREFLAAFHADVAGW